MTAGEAPEETHPTVDPRWPTRVFATECIKKIIMVCQSKDAHFDLAQARTTRQETGEGWLRLSTPNKLCSHTRAANNFFHLKGHCPTIIT